MMQVNRLFKRGEIYFVELPSASGSVQGGKRPVLVIQNDLGNKYSNNIIVCSLTTKVGKRELPTHVRVGLEEGLRYESDVQCESIITLDKRLVSFDSYITTLSEEKMQEVERALQISLGIFAPQKQQEVTEVDMTIIHDIHEMIKTRKVTMGNIVSVFKRLCKSYNVSDELNLV